MRNKTFSNCLILIGAVCLLLATLLVLKVWVDEYQASKAIVQLREEFFQEYMASNDNYDITPHSKIDEIENVLPDDTAHPSSGKYVACLFIPALELSLPVQSEWSETLLKSAPCRYLGTIAEKNIIIAGHNYKSHFGRLRHLNVGDSISLVAIDGAKYLYTVSNIEVLDSTALDAMEAGNWDLTLFTCTTQGTQRLTIRCAAQEAN